MLYPHMLSCIVMIMIIGLLEPWIKRALFITADNECANFFYNNNIEERKSARASLNPYFKRSACVYRLLQGSGWTCELLPTAYRLMRTELQSFTQMIPFFSFLFLSVTADFPSLLLPGIRRVGRIINSI